MLSPFALAWGFAVFGKSFTPVTSLGGFYLGNLLSVGKLISFPLVFFLFHFFGVLAVLLCSWGVKRGFFYSSRFRGKVECGITCRNFILSSNVFKWG